MYDLILLALVRLEAATPAPTPESGAFDPQSVIGLLFTAGISAGVLGAIITGVVQYLINRRNSRILERRNAVDAESDLVSRYREAAAEERTQKESAIQTIGKLLAIAETQIVSLKATVDSLTNTIRSMNEASDAQRTLIEQLKQDRDRVQDALDRALSEVEEQKLELLRNQRQILDLTYNTAEIDLERIRRESASQE